MLGRLFAKKRKANGTQLAMPLFLSTEGLTPPSICEAWSRIFPERPPLVSSDGDSAEVMQFDSGGETVMVMVMPMRIPTPEIEEAAQRSWMWKDEFTPRLAQYHAHAVVTSPGNGSTVEAAVASAAMVTRTIAAMISAVGVNKGCAGVYWGSGGVVHIPGLFKDMAIEMLDDDGGGVPPLWINVLASADSPSGPFTLSTTGMEPFGLDEIEIVDSREPIGDLRMRIYEAASYLLQNGPVIKDGQTFGRSETERFKVRVGRSKLGKPGTVMRFEIP